MVCNCRVYITLFVPYVPNSNQVKYLKPDFAADRFYMRKNANEILRFAWRSHMLPGLTGEGISRNFTNLRNVMEFGHVIIPHVSDIWSTSCRS